MYLFYSEVIRGYGPIPPWNRWSKFLLSERFTQDPVESFFGQQRQKGGGSENPTVHQFTYNTSSLRVQRSTAPIATSNVRASKHHKDTDVVDDTPLPKRQRRSKN